jgi:GntR family transcriptional regulator, arabinose operon transcriptional repressor
MPSKYVQIASLLRTQILEGTYQSTMRLPTEMELSESYQVNRQTVRRALSILTQEGLIERHQGSGSYIKDTSSAHGTSIAILATYINDYIFPAILQDAQTVFASNGYSTMVYCTHNQVNMERDILENILNSPVCGLLVEGTKTALPNPNLDLYKKLSESGVPVVFLHGTYAALSNAVCICDDDYYGGYLLTRYLLQKGHTHIAGIFKSDDIQGHNRYYGFLSALRDAGVPLPDEQVLWYTTEEKNQILSNEDLSFLQNFIKHSLKGITALVCYNDEIAFSLVDILLSYGIRIPEDLAIVSFDNSSYSEFCSVKITSLEHGSKHIGRVAAERLIDMLHGKQVQSEAAPWILVEKDSC